ncbi:MAG: ATP-binding protein [Candidatus Omnitrophota bacterium]
MPFHSIRIRASLLYSGILCLILTLFSAYLFQTVKHTLYRNTAEALRLKAQQINGIIDAYAELDHAEQPSVAMMRQFLTQRGEFSGGREVINELWEKDSRSLGLAGDMFRIINLHGQVVLRSTNLSGAVERMFTRELAGCQGRVCYVEAALPGGSFYAVNYPFMFSNRSEFVLQLATPLAAVEKILSNLLMFMSAGVLFILLMTVFMGSFLTRRILQPVLEVTRIANNISQKNLGVRLTGPTQDGEMGLLVDSFNQMIGRLEKSFMHINEFSSQVAHELKTPLAVMKGELELALSRPGLREEEARVMGVMLQEVDRLTLIIKDLLLLARYEYRLDVFKMQRLELGAFIKDLCRHVQALADEKGLRLALTVPAEGLFVMGDGAHLKRLFFNLAHNAVKFTPPGGEVAITARLEGGSARIDVADTGEGIAPEDQAKVFEKFFRVKRLDGAETPGIGLGLALAASIARAHGGEIRLKSAAGQGATFSVILPSG